MTNLFVISLTLVACALALWRSLRTPEFLTITAISERDDR